MYIKYECQTLHILDTLYNTHNLFYKTNYILYEMKRTRPYITTVVNSMTSGEVRSLCSIGKVNDLQRDE